MVDRLARSPQHVVITGASSGLGASLARYYAKRRVMISLLGRDSVRTATIARQCQEAGAQVFPETGNISDSDFMKRWLDNCDARLPVDLVIANAGVGGRFAMAGESGETVGVAQEIFATNLFGVANTILPILPRFVKRRKGHLVLMSSLAGYVGLPDAPAYSASKAAVRVYGDGLRRLLAPHSIYVSVVCPGFVRTPMSAGIPGNLPFLWKSDRAARYIAERIARGRREIAFPWPLSMLTRIASMLPAPVLDSILGRVRRNPGNA